MPRPRLTLLATSLVTLGVLAFLWLPVLRLYATGEVLSLARLKHAFLSPLSQSLLVNTLLLCALSALLAILFGVLVAIAAARGPRPPRPIILLLCALPIVLPPTLMASAYLEYSRTPPARSVASLAADNAIAINAVFVAAPVLAFCFFPVIAFAVWTALRSMPRDWEEAGFLFGDPLSAWKGVLLPLLAPAIFGGAAIVAALAMWEMGAPDLLDARSYSVQIYRAFSAGGSASDAALSALPMFLLGALFFIPAWHALKFYDRWKMQPGEVSSTPGRASLVATLAATLVLFVSPLAALLVFVRQAKSWQIFSELWDANRTEIWNTFAAPAMAAGLIAVLALLLVLLWRGYSPRMQRVVLALALAPLLFAPILLAVSLLEFYNRPAFDSLYESRYGLLVAGLFTRFLPLGVLCIYEAVRRVPSTLEEAAQNLGASKRQVSITIFLPLVAPAMLALLAVLFALCAGELSLSVLLNAPGGQILPVPIFNQMHIGATQSVAALSLILVAMSGGELLALLALSRKLQRR